MQSVILFDNEYVTLSYLPDAKMLQHVIHKPVDEEIFKQALNLGVDALKTYNINRWLSDDRKNGPFSPEFSAWVINGWIPRAIANGWQYWANIVPNDTYAAASLMPFIQPLAELGLKMMLFTNIDEAHLWIRNLKA